MTVAEEKIVKRIIHQVGLKNNLRDVDVEKIVNSQYKFIFETIKNLELNEKNTEELGEMRLNFILKYIGKIHTSADIIEAYNKRTIYINKNLDGK